MAKSRKLSTKTFRSNFTFGAVMAEADPLLKDAYWDNGDFEALTSAFDPRCFVIGRTGSGKSAAFQYLQDCHPNQVVQIVPENLALPYLTNLDVIRQLRTLGVHLDPFLRALWKHVFLVELLRFRYKINSPDAKRNIFEQLRDRFSKNPGRQMALDYLDEFGDRFWCETDERVKQIAESFEEKVKAVGSVTAGIEALGATIEGDTEATRREELRTELKERYQKVVNDVQLPRLNSMMDILNDEVFPDRHPLTYLVIDDLDKDWVEDGLLALMIRCLFETVVDMKRVKRVKILVALRQNLFDYVKHEQERFSGQKEKVRELSIVVHWTANDLRGLLDSRARAACNLYGINPPLGLSEMLPKTNRSHGDPIEFILSKTLMRPRDGILFLNECIREAAGKNRIPWTSIKAAEQQYSTGRLQALCDEWNLPYSGLDKILEVFTGASTRLDRTQLSRFLENVALLVADHDFTGTPWLSPLFQNLWGTGSNGRTWEDLYGPVTDVLFRISFLGLAKSTSGVPLFSYDKGAPVSIIGNMTDHTSFVIHPAFSKGLRLSEVWEGVTDKGVAEDEEGWQAPLGFHEAIQSP